MVVGFTPGSAPDIVARLIGQWLSERLGQQFITENRPGGGGNIGTEAVVRAASVLVGRHGAMNPAGRARIRNIMLSHFFFFALAPAYGRVALMRAAVSSATSRGLAPKAPGAVAFDHIVGSCEQCVGWLRLT